MKIRYISCDGETEVEDDIIKAEFYEAKRPWHEKVYKSLLCERSPKSPYYENGKDNTFEVDFDSVLEITE